MIRVSDKELMLRESRRKKQQEDIEKESRKRLKILADKNANKKKMVKRSAQVAINYKTFPYSPGMGNNFYATREWRELRWKVLSTSTGQCSVCGRSKKSHGVVLHVDHIKPRSRFPDLELVQSNMQVLCEACNLGKGAKDQF